MTEREGLAHRYEPRPHRRPAHPAHGHLGRARAGPGLSAAGEA